MSFIRDIKRIGRRIRAGDGSPSFLERQERLARERELVIALTRNAQYARVAPGAAEVYSRIDQPWR